MTQSSFALLTNKGRQKEAAALGNGTAVVITHIAIGDGTTVPSGGETQLYNEVARKTISGQGVVAGAPTVAYADIYLAAADGPYTIHEAGLIDEDGDLIAIAHYDPPIAKPTPDSGQTVEGTIRLEVAFTDLAAVTIKVDPSMTVALQRLSVLPWIPVLSVSTPAPPADPALGDTYVIPAGATGSWATHANKVAEYTLAGWAIIAPRDGHGVGLPDGRVYMRIGGVYVELTSTDTRRGLIELATSAEVQTGTDAVRAVTPAGLASLTATDTRRGLIEVANSTEIQAEVRNDLAITPAGLATVVASTTRRGLVELATESESKAGVDAGRAVTPGGVKAAMDQFGLFGDAVFHGGGSNFNAIIDSGNYIIGGAGSINGPMPDGANAGYLIAIRRLAGVWQLWASYSTHSMATRYSVDDGATWSAWRRFNDDASETLRGLIELATSAEVQTGTDAVRAVTPAGLSARTATETRTGLIEVANSTEIQAEVRNDLAITPAGLATVITSETRRGLVELATVAEALARIDTQRAVTPAGLAAVAKDRLWTAGGTANAWVINPFPAFTTYDGLWLIVRAAAANTGPVTVDVNGLGVKAVRDMSGNPLEASDVITGQHVLIAYDSAAGYFTAVSLARKQLNEACILSNAGNFNLSAGVWTQPVLVTRIDPGGWKSGNSGILIPETGIYELAFNAYTLTGFSDTTQIMGRVYDAAIAGVPLYDVADGTSIGGAVGRFEKRDFDAGRTIRLELYYAGGSGSIEINTASISLVRVR